MLYKGFFGNIFILIFLLRLIDYFIYFLFVKRQFGVVLVDFVFFFIFCLVCVFYKVFQDLLIELFFGVDVICYKLFNIVNDNMSIFYQNVVGFVGWLDKFIL